MFLMNEELTIITWVNNVAIIIYNELRFDTNIKPELSFQFDTLYYEPPTNHFVKSINNEFFELTEEEKLECNTYCKTYVETADYPVYAYDDKFIFVGRILKSEAVSKNYGYTILEEPGNVVSKYVTNHWESVVAIIMDDGSLRLNPGGRCERCTLFFTEEEWKTFPKQPTSDYIYDTVNQEWIDPRKIADVLHETQLEIRNYFEAIRWKEWGKYIPQYEQLTWRDQIEEAQNYLADSTSETPYIDTFLNERTDINKPTKEALCNDILNNNREYKIAMAKVNAKQWNYLKRAEACTTNTDLDAIRSEIRELMTSVGRSK
jgi:hypothetical protein